MLSLIDRDSVQFQWREEADTNTKTKQGFKASKSSFNKTWNAPFLRQFLLLAEMSCFIFILFQNAPL